MKLRYQVAQRMAWIAKRLREHGTVGRGDLRGEFGISIPQCTNDIKRFLGLYPGSMTYDERVKRYVANPDKVPKPDPVPAPVEPAKPPGKPVVTLPAAFACIYAGLAEVARAHGYALAVHGTLARDFDLIAVAWTEDAKPAPVLVEAIRARVSGVVQPDGTPAGRWNPERQDFARCVVRQPEPKPHGREAWTIHLGGGPFIDLSVIPPKVIP